MLLIPCPYCGDRSELEFVYAGEAGLDRNGELPEFLYLRSNEQGPHAERWRHTHGCARYFNVVRDTGSDRILCSYRIGEAPP